MVSLGSEQEVVAGNPLALYMVEVGTGQPVCRSEDYRSACTGDSQVRRKWDEWLCAGWTTLALFHYIIFSSLRRLRGSLEQHPRKEKTSDRSLSGDDTSLSSRRGRDEFGVRRYAMSRRGQRRKLWYKINSNRYLAQESIVCAPLLFLCRVFVVYVCQVLFT